jgi:WXG100 family type VII secretion target
MPGLGTEVDGDTINRTIQTMLQTDAQCDAAQRAVDNTNSYLTSQWHGQAANQFTASIARWQDGLRQVQSGLRDLNTAMETHYHTTATIEDDNSGRAASWT